VGESLADNIAPCRIGPSANWESVLPKICYFPDFSFVPFRKFALFKKNFCVFNRISPIFMPSYLLTFPLSHLLTFPPSHFSFTISRSAAFPLSYVIGVILIARLIKEGRRPSRARQKLWTKLASGKSSCRRTPAEQSPAQSSLSIKLY